MKLTYLLVQVALVAAGLFVYDAIKGEPVPPPQIEDPAPLRSEAPATPAPAAVPLVLAGTGTEGLRVELESLAGRMTAIERTLATRTTAIAGTSTPSAYPEAPAPGTVDPGAEEAGPAITSTDIDRFRTLKAEADRVERRERYVAMIDRQLNHLEVSLSEQQRLQVVDTTIQYRDKVRKALQASAAKGEDREARQVVLDQLRGEYEQSVYSLVPSRDASKVVDTLARYPGFGVRRGGAGSTFRQNR